MSMHPVTAETPLVNFLRKEFLRRKKSNSSYSLRAYSRNLGVKSGRLSEYLNGKRSISRAMEKKLVLELGLKPEIEKQVLSAPIAGNRNLILEAEVELLRNPMHITLLTLIETKNFRNNETWIAKRLKIHVEEVRDLMNRLIELGFVERKDGTLKLNQKGICTTHDIPSAALKAAHRNLLNRAIESIDNHPVDLRDISSIQIAINRENLPELKEKIKKFRREILKFSEKTSKEEVYSLQVQLFPLTAMAKD